MRLESKSPFSPTVTLESNWLRHQTFSWPERNGWFYGVINGHAAKVRQSPEGIQFRGEAPKKAVRRYFRLDEDITEVHEALSRKDPKMKWLVERYGDMRILRQDPWECLVSFICAQRRSIEKTSEDLHGLAKAAHNGDPLRLDGQEMYPFPGPEQTLCLGKASGSGLPLSGPLARRKQETIVRVAEAVTENERYFEELAGRSHEDARTQLQEIVGIGPKTADCVCLFALGQGESFPIDTHIQSALGNLYGKGKGRKWAQGYFGPNAGYASQLLFLSDIL